MLKKLILILSLPLLVLAESLPNGSWQQSCSVSNASYLKGVLISACTKNGGDIQTISKLNYAESCQTNSLVKNDNGNLACVTPKVIMNNSEHIQAHFPGGNWVTSCRTNSASINSGMLITQCRNNQGQFIPAAIDLSTCKNDQLVDNDNGRLSCNRRSSNKKFNDGLPAGQWRENCDVKGATLSMNVLHTKCKLSSGNYFPQMLFYDNCQVGSSVSSDSRTGDLSCDQSK